MESVWFVIAMAFYIGHIDNLVMNVANQKEVWYDVSSKFQVLHSDPPISAFIDWNFGDQAELLAICGILRRAFFTFLRRAGAVYRFLYPQIFQDRMAEALIQLWLGLSIQQREIFYYGKPGSSFNAEMLDILANFPPSILER